MRHYTKQPERASETLDRYVERGLIVPDRKLALAYINFVGAYRLKGFWLPLFDGGTKRFAEGASFERIIER